jgi:AraC-like DNA-binding protein
MELGDIAVGPVEGAICACDAWPRRHDPNESEVQTAVHDSPFYTSRRVRMTLATTRSPLET